MVENYSNRKVKLQTSHTEVHGILIILLCFFLLIGVGNLKTKT